jgi:hypothetical protein
MAVRDNVLFAVNKAATPRSVVAFDLTSGEGAVGRKGKRGRRADPADRRSRCEAVENGTSDGYLMLIDPKSGNTTVVGSGVMSPVWPSIETITSTSTTECWWRRWRYTRSMWDTHRWYMTGGYAITNLGAFAVVAELPQARTLDD